MTTKLTQRALKQIIREEINRVLLEAPTPGPTTSPMAPMTMGVPVVQQSMDAPPSPTAGRRRRRRGRKSKCNPQMTPCKKPEECAKRSEQASRGLYRLFKEFPEGSGDKDWRVLQYNVDKGANVLRVLAKAICYAEKAVKFWESHRKYACSKLDPLYDTAAGDGMPFSPGSHDCAKRVKALKRRIEDLRHKEESLRTVDSDLELAGKDLLKDWPSDVKTPGGQIKADAAAEEERKAERRRELGL